jgi:hypothetical protein
MNTSTDIREDSHRFEGCAGKHTPVFAVLMVELMANQAINYLRIKAIPLIAHHPRSAEPVTEVKFRSRLEARRGRRISKRDRIFGRNEAVKNLHHKRIFCVFFNDLRRNSISSLGTPEPSIVTGSRVVSSSRSAQSSAALRRKRQSRRYSKRTPPLFRIHPHRILL